MAATADRDLLFGLLALQVGMIDQGQLVAAFHAGRLEAEITGGLEHPGIVPVYGLGAYGDGRPNYAMRFIRGDSLKGAITAFHPDQAAKADPGARSLALGGLLRRFIDVCNAIDYAHTRGVLHRDIKPGNVIVGNHGETLVVDWVLAKAVGRSDDVASDDERTLNPSSSGGSSETLPGSALDTPAYISPEQAAGDLDRLGPRSDVYGLGATLFCLLTGKPPFEKNDLGTTLRAVKAEEFSPPRRRSDDRPGVGGGVPEGNGDEAGGPLRLVPCPGRRRRAVGGQRAGARLARTVPPQGQAVGQEEPHGRYGGGRGPVSRGRRALGGAGGGDPVQGRFGEFARPRDPGERSPGELARRGSGAVRPGRGGDQDISYRRERGLPALGGQVQILARPAPEVSLGLPRQARGDARQGNGPGLATCPGGGELRSRPVDRQGGRSQGGSGVAPPRAGGARGAGRLARCRRRHLGRLRRQPGGRCAPGVGGGPDGRGAEPSRTGRGAARPPADAFPIGA